MYKLWEMKKEMAQFRCNNSSLIMHGLLEQLWFVESVSYYPFQYKLTYISRWIYLLKYSYWSTHFSPTCNVVLSYKNVSGSIYKNTSWEENHFFKKEHLHMHANANLYEDFVFKILVNMGIRQHKFYKWIHVQEKSI